MSRIVRALFSGAGAAGLFVVVALAFSAACGAMSSPSNPSQPSTPACQLNNTAQVTFENRSTSNATYSVLWDGVVMTTLAPSVKSSSYTVAAGIPHTLVFKLSNSNDFACTPSTPTLAQCSSMNYWCTY